MPDGLLCKGKASQAGMAADYFTPWVLADPDSQCPQEHLQVLPANPLEQRTVGFHRGVEPMPTCKTRPLLRTAHVGVLALLSCGLQSQKSFPQRALPCSHAFHAGQHAGCCQVTKQPTKANDHHAHHMSCTSTVAQKPIACLQEEPSLICEHLQTHLPSCQALQRLAPPKSS